MKPSIKQLTKVSWLILIAVIHTGCSTFAATNEPLSNNPSSFKKAQFKIEQDRGNKQKSLVILALSGGGSRAAVLSSSVMLELEKVFSDDGLNILEEVDVISSVSGGSLPAAYYAISQDSGTEVCETCPGRYWDTETVNDLMRKDYVSKWFRNWFWPDNIVKYWFTAYDRSDIMAQTFADNLYDTRYLGFDLTFADINPKRPNLIINSTNGTTYSTSTSIDNKFGKILTFTSDDFIDYAGSDIYQYEISRAVMASASFPAVFNFMTLYDHRSGHNDQYIHVFDGGNADNLGLLSAERVIKENTGYERIIVILVDAFTESQGVSSEKPDARSLFSFFVDLNFIDSSNSLLENNRKNLLDNFKAKLDSRDKSKTLFYHVRIQDTAPDLRNQLNAIATDFKIEEDDANKIDQAMKALIVKRNPCLQDIRHILLDGKTSLRDDVYCTWKEDSSLSAGKN
ncbi:MAG: patatin-like phospholipase family protein [Gammaproteobacteria bacterium]|nr:patatin-like phospholipase family protein [Gammaproteobacteria bacterium]